MENIAQRLKRLRLAAGLSQRQVSERTGGLVLNQTICQIETGYVKSVSSRTIALLAAALDCDPAYLAGYRQRLARWPADLALENF